MGNEWPLVWFIASGTVWLAVAVQAHRAFRSFVSRHPEEASRRIPFAFVRMKHPEKFLFLFRKDNLQLLRDDAKLWSQRRNIMFLLLVGFLISVGGFVALAATAYLVSQHV